jgi:hypothetical protein
MQTQVSELVIVRRLMAASQEVQVVGDETQVRHLSSHCEQSKTPI